MTQGRPTHLPVLVTAFKRADTTRQVFESLRIARPPRLYFACDGGRNEKEWQQCAEVRALAGMVDWPCELHTRFSDVNRGSKWGMSEAISWFFDHEEEGIVLEDDIVPAQSFFPFCAELLERYRNDERIWAINGNNLMTEWPYQNHDSYWFSEHGYGAYWGWASWRRSWRRFDVNMASWPMVRDSGLLDGYFISAAEKDEAMAIFEATWNGTIPTAWDYQFDLAKILNRGMNIIPSVNLCRNIGFVGEGTHTVKETDIRNKEELHEIDFPLVHPATMLVDAPRDKAYFERYVRTPLFRRFKNAIKALLPDQVDKAITPFLGEMQRKLGLG